MTQYFARRDSRFFSPWRGSPMVGDVRCWPGVWEKLLTAPESAEHLGVRTSTIYQWTHQEFIPHVKLGKLVRFREGDVVRWLEDRASAGRKVRKIDVRELGV